MSTDDELRELLDNTARDIARISPNPSTWLGWVVYLLMRLEKESFGARTGSREEYKSMLSALQDSIRNYFRTGSF
jgi:hypothetical protein